MKEIADLQLTIPSTLEKIADVELYVDKVTQKMGFSEDERDNLAIAVSEAVTNAILHGNKKDRRKKVTIRFRLSADKVTVYVKDEGEGFDPGQLKNPLDPENILKETGRGIFILKSIMDEVDFDFSKGGTEVKIVKFK